MARYKLVGGPHFERDADGNSVQYTAGGPNNIVESDEDLVAKHPNKFELLPEEQRMKSKKNAPQDEEADDEEAPKGKKGAKKDKRAGQKAKTGDEESTGDPYEQDDTPEDESDEDFFGNNTDIATKASKTQVEPAESLHEKAKAAKAKAAKAKADGEGTPSKIAKPERAGSVKEKKVGRAAGKKSKKS